MVYQRTLAKEVFARGVGLHAGVEAVVVLRPAAAGYGVVLNGEALRPDMVRWSPLCTLLELEGGSVSTVEHLFSALHGMGVDNVDIAVEGPEVPILDGSALPWVSLLDEAGRVELEVERAWLKVASPVILNEEGRTLVAEPDPREGLRVGCVVDFPHPAIGRQEWAGVVDEEVYRRDIAPARTFVLERDIAAAQAAGLAKGGSLHNAVVFADDGTVKNPEGLRFADEPVRHKVLDAVGDLFLAGRPVWGKFSLTAPGHTANNRLLRRILDTQA